MAAQYFDTFVKSAGSSSDGTIIMVTPDNKYFAFNSDKCRKIVGITDYLSCYIGNTIRVFTPAKVWIYDNSVHVQFSLEKTEFVAGKCPIPDWFMEECKEEIKTLEETQ